jgi:hypothetical protein
MVAAVDGDRSHQPVGVGAHAVVGGAGAAVQDGFGAVQRAIEPARLGAHQRHARFGHCALRVGEGGNGQQRQRFLRQRERADGVALAQVPGQRQQQRHALGVAQPWQRGFPARHFFIDSEHVHLPQLHQYSVWADSCSSWPYSVWRNLAILPSATAARIAHCGSIRWRQL